MPGKRFLLDTNAVVALLQGHSGLAALTDDAQWLGISVITALEFSGFPDLTDADRALFAAFVARVEVVDLAFSNTLLTGNINILRRTRALKLPDAIILGTAVASRAVLLTHDEQLPRMNGAADNAVVQRFDAT